VGKWILRGDNIIIGIDMNADVRKAQENLTVAFKELHLGKPLAAAKQLEFQKEQIKK
jgi:hypothetical protein